METVWPLLHWVGKRLLDRSVDDASLALAHSKHRAMLLMGASPTGRGAQRSTMKSLNLVWLPVDPTTQSVPVLVCQHFAV